MSDAHAALCRAAGRLALMLARRRVSKLELVAARGEAEDAVDKLTMLISTLDGSQ